MKAKFIFAATACLLSTMAITPVFAQDSNNSTTDSSSTSSTTDASASSSATAPVTAAPSTAGTGTSTASLPQAAAEVKKRKVKGEFYNLNSIGVRDLNLRNGAPNSQNYLGVKFALGEAKSLSVRQLFDYAYPKEGTSGKATTGDIYLSYTDAKLAQFSETASLTGNFRAYLPTGEASRLRKSHGALRAWLIASMPVKKFDVNYHVIGHWNNHSQNGYMVPNPKAAEAANKAEEQQDGEQNGGEQAQQTLPEPFIEKANSDYFVSQYADVGYNFSDKLSLSQSLGTTDSFTRPITGQGVTRESTLDLLTALSWAPVPQLSLMVGVENNINIKNPDHSFSLWRDNELTGYFLISASI